MQRDESTGTQQRDEELDLKNAMAMVKHGYGRCGSCKRIVRILYLGDCGVCGRTSCGRKRCRPCLCDVAALRSARVAASGLKLVRSQA
jgi:hypothetical protein